MADKNVILKDGEDILYPKTLLSLVDGMPQPTSADNGKMLGVENGAYGLVEGGGGSYLHHVSMQSSTTTYVNVLLIMTSATPLAAIDVREEMSSNGSNAYEKFYPATGFSDNFPVVGFFNNAGNLSLIRVEPSFGGRIVTPGLMSWVITDIVTAL